MTKGNFETTFFKYFSEMEIDNSSQSVNVESISR